MDNGMVDTQLVVEALRNLVVFGPGQAGAYRELYGPVGDQLGPDVPTKLHGWLSRWALGPNGGLVILTGNAGTGKTAATEHFCKAMGSHLPRTDALVPVGTSFVVKDASGIASRILRATMFRQAIGHAASAKVLMCVNEGILRDAAEDLENEHPELLSALQAALDEGATRSGYLTIVNLNRQRLTQMDVWHSLLELVSRAEIWSSCDGCPSQQLDGDLPHFDGDCPMRTNAEALRRPDTREVLRLLVQTCSGGMVPTMREVLALLAYTLCGDGSGDAGDSGMWRCQSVQDRFRDRGKGAFTVSSSYFNLFFGVGLNEEAPERSPLLGAISRLGVGVSADLEVDEWLRDSGRSPLQVQELAGAQPSSSEDGPLSGSRSHLDRVRTENGEVTFNRLGETIAISEDTARVAACMRALVSGAPPAQWSWRRRLLLEGSDAIGGASAAVSRLTAMSFCRLF